MTTLSERLAISLVALEDAATCYDGDKAADLRAAARAYSRVADEVDGAGSIDDLRAKLATAEKQRLDLVVSDQQWRRANDALHTRIAALTEDSEGLLKQRDEAQASIATAEAQRDEWITRAEERFAEIERARGIIDGAKAQIATAERERDEARADAARVLASGIPWKARAEQLQNVVDEYDRAAVVAANVRNRLSKMLHDKNDVGWPAIEAAAAEWKDRAEAAERRATPTGPATDDLLDSVRQSAYLRGPDGHAAGVTRSTRAVYDHGLAHGRDSQAARVAELEAQTADLLAANRSLVTEARDRRIAWQSATGAATPAGVRLLTEASLTLAVERTKAGPLAQRLFAALTAPCPVVLPAAEQAAPVASDEEIARDLYDAITVPGAYDDIAGSVTDRRDRDRWARAVASVRAKLVLALDPTPAAWLVVSDGRPQYLDFSYTAAAQVASRENANGHHATVVALLERDARTVMP